MPRVAVTLHNNAPRDLPEHIQRHVPHYCALEAATHAWNRVLVDAFDGEFDPVTDIALVNVNSNFSGELFTDAAEVGVEVAKIGTTSVTLRVEIVQGGTRAADLSVTLVQVGDGRTVSRPWSPEQIVSLEALHRPGALADRV